MLDYGEKTVNVGLHGMEFFDGGNAPHSGAPVASSIAEAGSLR
jgi:hypothetical protein